MSALPPQPPTPTELAELSLRLLRDGVPWIVRRKESVKLLDDRTLRRQESVDIDLRLVGEPLRRATAGGPVYYVPLFFLRKLPHQFFNFDVCDETGRRLPLPTRSENAAVSSQLQRMASREALVAGGLAVTELPSGLDATCDEQLAKLASDPQQSDVQDLKDAFLRRVAAAHGTAHAQCLRGDPTFSWLMPLLTKSSVVMFRIADAEPERRIIKLGYDENLVDVADKPIERLTQRLGWDGNDLVIELPFIGSQSFHFQAEAPPGMQFVTTGLIERDISRPGEVRDDPDFNRKVHLYLPNTEHSHGALAWLLFSLRGEGFVGGALLAALLVALVLTGFAATAHLIADNSGSAPSLLLAVTGILASYVGRPGSHPLTTRLLAPVRWLVLASAGLAYLAAAVIAVNPGHVSSTILRPIWAGEALLAWMFVAILWFSWRLPRPPGESPSLPERLARRALATPLSKRFGLNVSRIPHPDGDPPTLVERLRPHVTRAAWRRRWKHMKEQLHWGDHRPGGP
jgi:hypothetical protein